MRAVEFKSKIRNNQILIPAKMQRDLLLEQDKRVRVMVFVEDSDVYDEKTFRHIATSQFFAGY
ncbi:MAG: hypothetical protein LBU84_18935, partial [Prevotella sp.]|nr:hypothetical protein [Prevotella sp.]